MTKMIMVHYDKGAFLIKCPFAANDLIHTLPAVRWSKAHQSWRAPVTRHNVESLVSKIGPFAQFTQPAQDAINQHIKRQDERASIETGFPSWYVHKVPPMAHQARGLNHLYPKTEAAVFMDMGTGKSKFAIDFNSCLRMEGKIDGWLIVCKVSLRENWVEQLKEHCNIPYSVHLADTTNVRGLKKWLDREHGNFPVLIAGTESLSAGKMIDLATYFVDTLSKPSMTVDESSLISGPKAIRSERCVALGRKCHYRQAMTGTPIADSPLNLYMQFEFLDPNIIGVGDFYAFRNRYAVMGGYRDPNSGKPLQVVGYQNIDELTKTIAPYTFQVRKKDVLDLPDKRYQVRTVALTEDQRKLYNNIKKDSGYKVEERDVALKNVLEKFMRLHQICGGHIGEMYEEQERGKVVRKSRLHTVVKLEDNPKIKELLAILEEAGSNQAIIWCAHRPEIEDVLIAIAKIPGASVAVLHGDVEESQRMRTVNDFQAGRIRYVVGNAQTGGMGFTMTAAQLVVYYSNTQKLIDRQQSEDRAHRIGQTGSVLYVDIVAEKTVDAVYLKALKNKQDVSDFVRERLGDAQKLLEGDIDG